MQVQEDSMRGSVRGSGCRHGTAIPAPSMLDMRSVFTSAVQAPGRPVNPLRAITVALVEVGNWRPWLADARRLLSASEAERVQRRRFAADRETLAVAYALHRLLLGSLLGMAPEQVPLRRDRRGCPRLGGDIAYTSLSHTKGSIAIAVTTSGPVGVDIEPRASAAVMPEIAQSICHHSEAVELAALDPPARGAALLALWVRKEALLKAAGIGLAVPMETFAAAAQDALMLPTLFVGAVQVRMLDAGEQCVGAVAGPVGASIDCHWLHPPLDFRVVTATDAAEPHSEQRVESAVGRA